MPSQALDGFCAVDEADLAKVHVIVAELLQSQVLVDSPRGDIWVMQKLCGAEKEREELVVVKSPDTMRSCRFEIICHLDNTHHLEVAHEHAEDEGLEVGLFQQAQLVETEEPDHKVQLVSRTVVDSAPVAKRLAKVCGKLSDGIVVLHADLPMPCGTVILC